MFHNYTLPPPADKIVADFAEKLYSIQPDFIEGIYLTGSLPLNDFYANKSDIDFLVVCKEIPDEKMAKQLKHIHKLIEDEYQKPDLSGNYLTLDIIRARDPENKSVLSYHQKKLGYQNFEMAPVSLWELKTHAFTIAGAPATSLPIGINRQKLNEFLHENINTYWTNWVKQYSSFFHRKMILLSFPRFTEWSVLGIARQYYTLQTGEITSKTNAGLYCLQHLPSNFHPIIKEAIEIRRDNRKYPIVKSYAIRPSFKRLMQTLECVNYLLAVATGEQSLYLDKMVQMKTMTCNQLGGACDMQFRAGTFEEMAELSKRHGLEMAKKGDKDHFQAMNTMQELMRNPRAMKEWFEDKRKEFNALPEDDE